MAEESEAATTKVAVLTGAVLVEVSSEKVSLPPKVKAVVIIFLPIVVAVPGFAQARKPIPKRVTKETEAIVRPCLKVQPLNL